MSTADEHREPTTDEAMGMAWWNSLSDSARAQWSAKVGTGVVADAWALCKASQSSGIDLEFAQSEAMKIMVDAKKLLEKTGLEVSLITRCPDGARWPVLMLEVGQAYSDIEAVRNGKR